MCSSDLVVVGQAADAVADVQLVLAHHAAARVTEQLIVMEQAAGYGVLNGYHADERGVLAHLAEHLLERGAAYQLYLLVLKVQVGGYVVERPCESLYGYSFHFFFILKKTPLALGL